MAVSLVVVALLLFFSSSDEDKIDYRVVPGGRTSIFLQR